MWLDAAFKEFGSRNRRPTILKIVTPPIGPAQLPGYPAETL